MRGGSLVGTEVLIPGDYRIGRSDECELHLDEPTLSRVHARLVFNGTRVGIQDLESDNGVLINGERVKAREVKSLDDVVLGRVTLKFKVIARKDQPAGTTARGPLDKTVPLAARPDAAALRAEAAAAAQANSMGRPPSRGGAAVAQAQPSLRDNDIDVTDPGELVVPGTINATQPSARLSQVAPEITKAPPQPPRPVIGLVPPPPSTAKAQPSKAVPPTAASPKVAPPPAPKPSPLKAAPPPSIDFDMLSNPGASSAKAQPVLDRTVPKAARADLLEASGPMAVDNSTPDTLAPGQQPSVRARVVWGNAMVACNTFAYGGFIEAYEDERAPLPLYNFGLGKKKLTLAKTHSSGWAVHVPQGVAVEVRAVRGWEATQPSTGPDGGGIVPLAHGTAVRLVNGKIKVEFLSVAPQPQLPNPPPKPELSILIPFMGAVGAVLSLIIFMPKNLDAPDFTPKALPALRAALVPPPEKKKPEEKKKEKEKPAEKKDKTPVKVVKQQAVKPPPPTKTPPPPQAVQAVQKLTAGPAMSSLLAATKLLTGGGRPNGMKMVGLKGVGPVALAGSGPGIGGGFGGGTFSGTQAVGKVANLDIGAVGKKRVEGTVVSSPARDTKIHGSMSREEIAKVVNAHYQQIRACYERALLREPGLAGKLQIEWTIDVAGGVSQVKTKTTTLKSTDVINCILDNVKTWRFPKPVGGEVVVNYPFIFNSAGF
jgi:hypothetical protein